MKENENNGGTGHGMEPPGQGNPRGGINRSAEDREGYIRNLEFKLRQKEAELDALRAGRTYDARPHFVTPNGTGNTTSGRPDSVAYSQRSMPSRTNSSYTSPQSSARTGSTRAPRGDDYGAIDNPRDIAPERDGGSMLRGLPPVDLGK